MTRTGLFHFMAMTCVAALLALTAGCSEQTSAPKTRPAISGLPTQTLITRNVATEAEFDGTVEAINQATVSAQTSGRVVSLAYDIGDLVPMGATVVQLTSTEQQAAVQAAQSAVAEATARFAQAERNFERSRAVFEKQMISRADFDKSKTEFNAAEARLDSARANLASAEEALSYTRITAPYAGILLERHVQAGETVAPGQPLLSGLSLQQLRVQVNVPANQIQALQTHKTAQVLLPDGRSIKASSLRFSPSANAQTQSFRVLAHLPEGDWQAYPGTLVKVRFTTGQQAQLLVPEDALIQRGEVTAVYLQHKDQSVSLRQVRVGQVMASQPGLVRVLAGLKEGDTVVTRPTQVAELLGASR